MKIMLDAGHGMHTLGKRCPDGSMREWQFNSAVAMIMRSSLEKYENVKIFFSHDMTGAVDVPLKERTDMANEIGVDLFLSIHANAAGSGWTEAQGIETFVYVTKPQKALSFALNAQAAMIKATGRKNRGVKTADFHVLRETHAPAILVECGFMSSKEEAELLKSGEYRKKIAAALTQAIVDHYGLIKKASPTPAPPVIPGEIWGVQVGAFSKKENAETLAAELKKKGYAAIIKKN